MPRLELGKILYCWIIEFHRFFQTTRTATFGREGSTRTASSLSSKPGVDSLRPCQLQAAPNAPIPLILSSHPPHCRRARLRIASVTQTVNEVLQGLGATDSLARCSTRHCSPALIYN